MDANRKEYFIENAYSEREKVIRDFLLSRADTISVTTKCSEKNEKLQKVFGEFQDDFIRKEVDNKKYFIVQSKRPLYCHYFYKLSPKWKDLLNKETLFFWSYYSYPDNYFFHTNLEDPAFFVNGVLLGHVITHEMNLFIYLTDEEKKLLEDKGIDLDPKQLPQKKIKWYFRIPLGILIFISIFLLPIIFGMLKLWDNTAHYFGKLTGKYK